MPFVAALSEHPTTAVAAGEVVGRVLEDLGPAVDLAVLFSSPHHAEAFGEVASVVRAALAPGALIGAVGSSVLAGDREVEHHAGLVLWAARGPRARTLVLDAHPASAGTVLTGLEPVAQAPTGTLLVLGEQDTFPMARLLAHATAEAPGLTILGGEVGLGNRPGPARLLADERVLDHGAVALLLPAGTATTAVLSQGTRPLGQPYVVTRAEGPLVLEIGGRPALDRLAEVRAELPAGEPTAWTGPRLGRLLEEAGADHGRGDFLVDPFRPDPGTGGIIVTEAVAVGTTVRFHGIDAGTAEEDLRELLAPVAADAALVFTGVSRGMRLFGRPDVDARIVRHATGPAVAGLFTLSEVGPVGPRPARRRGSVAVLAFGEA